MQPNCDAMLNACYSQQGLFLVTLKSTIREKIHFVVTESWNWMFCSGNKRRRWGAEGLVIKYFSMSKITSHNFFFGGFYRVIKEQWIFVRGTVLFNTQYVKWGPMGGESSSHPPQKEDGGGGGGRGWAIDIPRVVCKSLLSYNSTFFPFKIECFYFAVS